MSRDASLIFKLHASKGSQIDLYQEAANLSDADFAGITTPHCWILVFSLISGLQ